MTAAQGDGQLKYQRIADALRAAIASGEYGPGDRLPGENELMATYQVARMTARQALGVLRSEGIAEARKGAGVFVRTFRPIRRHGIQRLARDGWGTGQSVWEADVGAGRELVVDSVVVRQEPTTEGVASVLGLEPGDPVCVRGRRFVLDGKPVLLSVSHLPASLVAGTAIAEEDSGPGGIYARLAELGQAPAHFREEIRCRMPTTAEAKQLQLSSGTPVVLVCRTAFTAEGRAVEVNEMTLDASSYILEYDFDA
ncbi:GntR family transcriptional regulator [Streptomyces sp. AC536]|uniref:GntR family transcriptional regulator n=1 Tax=Streptomyces buecherae TaxID=2763006 RepID=UPI00164E1170|nr:GntR family transcriptional regulator [Streptomyces buecherae]MBC3987161.1 GntR family transcriptional regulator [Streptomyces buecherae]QNJ42986.1 GntR family transcriptional regulator [Streptomyces buecherae]